jgi:hypothetical protein
MIEEWNKSAENLLFHFCCVLRGGMGFRAAQDKMHDLKEREALDDAAVRYISKVLELLPQKRGCPRPSQTGRGVYYSHICRVLAAGIGGVSDSS